LCLAQLLDTINPTNQPGKVTLITRMNPDKLRKHLPELIRAVQREGRQVRLAANFKFNLARIPSLSFASIFSSGQWFV
jgi:3-deoxy-D-arabino-heptulosonate 7-phosphate (DAHP) synthase class II